MIVLNSHNYYYPHFTAENLGVTRASGLPTWSELASVRPGTWFWVSLASKHQLSYNEYALFGSKNRVIRLYVESAAWVFKAWLKV